MKKIVAIYLLFLGSNILVAQEQTKNFNFVLVVNDEIISKTTKLTFVIKTESLTENITAKYYPGELVFNSSDYEKIISDNTKNIYLKYNDIVYIDGKANNYEFEFEYQKNWLQDLYNILRIYDLRFKKYKNKFKPLSETKNYTFELTSPNSTFLRVRKK